MIHNSFLKPGLLLISVAAFLLVSCSKDNDAEENEEEIITTLQLSFVPLGGGSTLTYQFEDPDGPGGANPVADPIDLAPNTSYAVSLQVWNRTVNPAEDITEEIAEESVAHRFYYEPSPGSNITVSNLNNDADGQPLGLVSTWGTGAAAIGTIKVTLRHYAGNPPNKLAEDPVNSPKSATDIEVQFSTRVQ